MDDVEIIDERDEFPNCAPPPPCYPDIPRPMYPEGGQPPIFPGHPPKSFSRQSNPYQGMGFNSQANCRSRQANPSPDYMAPGGSYQQSCFRQNWPNPVDLPKGPVWYPKG